MNLREHTTDKNKSSKGVWKEFDGAQFLIAASNTPAYTRALSAATKRFPINKIRKDAALAAQAAREAMADAVLLDWKGVNDGPNEVKCTRENKLALLEIEAFRDWLATEAQDVSNFQAEAMAEDAETLKSGRDVVGEVGAEPGVPTAAS